MKIKKLDIETTIECECSCVFEFNLEDIHSETVQWYSLSRIMECKELYVICPICGKKHTIKEIY